ncbi:MAG: 1-acyl-sn-glycerol-3-phosphate acyltransferase, partial [Methylococcales bacterium]|nr:1-acyl-sn-glycerol-3-phosphate acyltransferase [Methylococcales bacterium]
MLYIRSGLLFLFMLSSTLIYCPLIIAALIFPFAVRYKLANQWVGLILWATKTNCRLNYQVIGQENIPLNKNAIILCKHQSAWETIALQKIFPTQIFLLKRELLWLPVWGWAMAALNPVAINRKSQKAALRTLIEEG